MSFLPEKKNKLLKEAFFNDFQELFVEKCEEYQKKFNDFKNNPHEIKDNFKDFRGDEEFISSLLTGWLTEDLMREFVNQKISPEKIVLAGTDADRELSQKNVLASPDFEVKNEDNEKLGSVEMKSWLSIEKDVFLKEYSVNHIKKTNGLILYYFLEEQKFIILSYPQILQFKKIIKWKKPGYLISSEYMKRKSKDIKSFKKWDLFKFY